MEHVLHDRAENLTDDEKEDLAFDIADQYTDQLEKNSWNIYMTMVFYVCGTYKDTWEFIMDGNNSLNRYCSYCNVAVYFNSWENWVKLDKKNPLTFTVFFHCKIFADPKNGTLGNK
mgnify:CR=1 FL=1